MGPFYACLERMWIRRHSWIRIQSWSEILHVFSILLGCQCEELKLKIVKLEMKYSELEAKYFEKEKERQHLTFQGYRHETSF